MNRNHRLQTFEREGRRENLAQVIKGVKSYIRTLSNHGIAYPTKIVFFTLQGEGPMLAYTQLGGLSVDIIAVMFPATYAVTLKDGRSYPPPMPDGVRKFFNGVGIPIISARLPFDEIAGAESHNREMLLLKDTLSVFGGSMPLAIQAVLQATDSGLIPAGEEVIAVTGDTALLVTASTTRDFLSKTCGLMVNDIICKPRNFSISRPKPKAQEPAITSLVVADAARTIEGAPPETV